MDFLGNLKLHLQNLEIQKWKHKDTRETLR
jgi:hypothetical protein